MSNVLQIWLIAAPPAWKFATMAPVTDGRKGGDPLRDDAVIAREHGDQRPIDMRPRRSLPGRHPFGDLLEAAERARGLGQLPLALARRRPRRLVGFGHFFQKIADVVERARGGHEMVSLTWQGHAARIGEKQAAAKPVAAITQIWRIA